MKNFPQVPSEFLIQLQKRVAEQEARKKAVAKKLKELKEQSLEIAITGMQQNGWVDVYTNQVPYELDILRTNMYSKTDLGFFIQTVLGVGVGNQLFCVGFPCAPIAPPGMSVTVGPGVIYYFDVLLPIAYSVIPPDSNPDHQIYKSYINFNTETFPTPAPVTPGTSIIYLIQAAHQTTTANIVSRPYFNDANPADPIFESQPDTLLDYTLLGVKSGVAASSPTPPTPDAGYIGLYYVTVGYGQTSIVSGDITVVPGAPFITESLTQKVSSGSISGDFVSKVQEQNSTNVFANDIGTVNTLIFNPSPAYLSYTGITFLRGLVANTNTGAATANISGLGDVPINILDSTGLIALTGGELVSGGIHEFCYNPTANVLQLMNPIEAGAGTDKTLAILGRSGGQTIGPSLTLISYNNTIYASPFVTISSNGFIPLIPGLWEITTFNEIDSTGSPVNELAVFLNGVNVAFIDSFRLVGGAQSQTLLTMKGTIQLSFNGTTDLVQIFASSSTGTGLVTGGNAKAQFSIKFISS